MTIVDRIRHALVIAPHPDDEVLGCGGTIARLTAMGRAVDVAIVTRGFAPRFEPEQADAVRAEALEAHRRLGVAHTHFLDFPAAELDCIPRADLNRAIGDVVATSGADTLFVPFVGDVHFDHRLVFESAMVAARPRGDSYPLRILAYETVSETNWAAPYLGPAFQPHLFIDIAGYVDAKLEAFSCFASQVRPFPDERSVEALRALAMKRGACVSRAAAEAFTCVREVA